MRPSLTVTSTLHDILSPSEWGLLLPNRRKKDGGGSDGELNKQGDGFPQVLGDPGYAEAFARLQDAAALKNAGFRDGIRHMSTKAIGLITKGSVAMIAALILTACGGGGDSGGSSGSTPVSVPNVVGDTQAAASSAITGAGLTVGTVTTQSSSSVASGKVISENPAAATSVAQGSAVTLVVSSGPAPVSVPNVVGDTQAAAAAAITGAGLTVGAVTSQESGTVAAGTVISESPAAATSVAKGSAVALVVSSGPPTYTVGGTLIGLAAGATVQVSNGATTLPVSANGSLHPVDPPARGCCLRRHCRSADNDASQTCTVQNGSGTVAAANVTSVVIYCTYTVTVATLNRALYDGGCEF